VLTVGRHGDPRVAETNFGQAEGGPIKARRKLISNRHHLRRRGGGRLVIEIDPIGELGIGLNEVGFGVAARLRPRGVAEQPSD
jgi:hypothetical protein